MKGGELLTQPAPVQLPELLMHQNTQIQLQEKIPIRTRAMVALGAAGEQRGR